MHFYDELSKRLTEDIPVLNGALQNHQLLRFVFVAFEKNRKMKRASSLSELPSKIGGISGGVLIRVRPWETLQAIEESKRLESVFRHRMWKDNVFEPIKRRIMKRVENRCGYRQGKMSPEQLSRQSADRITSSQQSTSMEKCHKDDNARLGPCKWSRDEYDSTVEGLQSRLSLVSRVDIERESIHGAPYQDHFNFPSKFAAFADAEFPRGRRICTLPRYYRRDPILSTISY